MNNFIKTLLLVTALLLGTLLIFAALSNLAESQKLSCDATADFATEVMIQRQAGVDMDDIEATMLETEANYNLPTWLELYAIVDFAAELPVLEDPVKKERLVERFTNHARQTCEDR